MTDIRSTSSRGGSGPLGIGDIVSRAFGLLNRNYLALFLLNLPLLLAPLAIYGLRYYELMSPASAFDTDPERVLAVQQMFGGGVTMFSANILTLVIWTVCTCGAIRLLNDSFDQQGLPAMDSVSTGARRIPAALGVMLVGGAVYLVAAFIVGLIIAVLASSSLAFSLILATVLGVALLVLAFPYLFALYACIIDERGPLTSFARSKSLTEFYRWPLLGLLLVACLVAFLMMLAYALVSGLLLRIGGGLLVLVAAGLFTPYYTGFVTSVFVVAYSRLKFLKEGSPNTAAVADVFE